MNVRKTDNHQGKNLNHHTLVLLLSAKEARVYLYDGDEFKKIQLNESNTIQAYERDLPSKVGNFSNAQAAKEILVNKFFLHIDHALGDVLKEHPVPLFIMGTKKTTGHFNKISKHAKKITSFINGNFNEHTMYELKQAIAPYVRALDSVK